VKQTRFTWKWHRSVILRHRSDFDRCRSLLHGRGSTADILGEPADTVGLPLVSGGRPPIGVEGFPMPLQDPHIETIEVPILD
jgi:hypothetical protein